MSAPTASTPKWQSVLADLQTRTLATLEPHDPLPSERSLMVTYGVSRMTVREALRSLAGKGLVYRIQGSGTFVAEPSRVSKSLALTSFSEDIRARGMVPGAHELARVTVPAPPAVAKDLGLSVGHMVMRLERVRTADDESMCLERVWVPLAVLGDAVSDRQPIESLYEVMQRAGALPVRADQTIRADIFDDEESRLLTVARRSPCLRVARIAHDARGRAVECGHSAYRADRYDFNLTITRPEAT